MCQSRNVLSQQPKERILEQVFSVRLMHLLPLLDRFGRGKSQSMWLHHAAVVRRVRIALLVAEAMVLAMHGNPSHRRAFSGHGAQQAEQAADPGIRLKTSVRQKAMVAQANPQAAADPGENAKRHQANPGEAERRRQCANMQNGNPADYRPIGSVGPCADHLALDGDTFLGLRLGRA